MFVVVRALIVAVVVCFMMRVRGYAQASVALVSDTVAVAQSLSDDFDAATRKRDYKFNPRQLIVPSLLITVGAAGITNRPLLSFRDAVRDEVAEISDGQKMLVDDYIQYLPVVAHLGLGWVGVRARNPFRERFMASLTASIVMGTVVNALKHTVKEGRPGTGFPNSFPSGHTATAFMGAELIRHEYPAGISIGAYSIAVLTGLLRVYNDRHWINDVFAGAGIGILSARVGYWMLPVYRRWFGWDRPGRQSISSFTALPVYDPATRSAGLSAAIVF